MTVLISVSSDKDDRWSAKADVFRWFAEEVAKRDTTSDLRVKDAMEVAMLVNGLSIDSLREEDPALARALISAVQSTAESVVSGDLRPNFIDETRMANLPSHFATLLTILNRSMGGLEASGDA